jgi:hypothetical protein
LIDPVVVANADISAKIVVVYGRNRRTSGSVRRAEGAVPGAGTGSVDVSICYSYRAACVGDGLAERQCGRAGEQ